MSSDGQQPPSLRPQLLVITLGRVLLNSGVRMAYPFLPAFARGVGVPLPRMGQAIALRSSAGLLSPLFAPLPERFGRKTTMLGAMLLFSAAMLVVVIWPAYWPLVLGLSLVAVAKVIYDPTMQAHLGDLVPYERRGRVLAVTELAWAGSLLLGGPLTGWLIQHFTWTTPFAVLGVGSLLLILLLHRTLGSVAPSRSRTIRLGALWQLIRQHPVILAAMVFIIGYTFANEMLSIVYGGWMEQAFKLDLTGLGLAATTIGVGEVCGEFAILILIDRLGKRRMIMIAGVLMSFFYLLLPLVANHLAAALVSLFLVYLCFEMVAVANVPLMTEIVPHARGRVMTLMVAASALGRALGAWIGPLLWVRYGIMANALVAAVLSLAAILVLARWVHEATPSP